MNDDALMGIVGEPRLWTLDDANAMLPQVKDWLKVARTALGKVRDEEDQVKDIEIVYAGVKDERHEAHQEWVVRHRRLVQARHELEAAVSVFDEHGIVLKDVDLGLVDFHSKRGDETVFLCWRAGEPNIHSWHPVNGGFAARKPLPDLRV